MNSIDSIRTAAQNAFAAESVVFAYLFGSQATGRTHPKSDVDVAVMLGPPPTDPLASSLRLASELRGALGGDQDIEVVVLNDAPLPLAGRVLRDRIVIYSRDEPARVD